MRKTLFILVVLIAAQPAAAVKVADITRIGGQRTNVLTGVGLVYGLKGTGDGGDFLPAIRPLAAMLQKFADPAQLAELSKAQNVAIVSLIATVPGTGARNGDHIDVHVMSLGAAASLKGGRLFVCPMQGPLPRSDKDGGIYALSEGAVDIEDPTAPLVGIVKGGCVMETDLPSHSIDNGKFTLILEDPSANWTTASYIARSINGMEGVDDRAELATAIDPKNIVVTIPPAERERPDSFISRVLRMDIVLVATEARVVINERLGTIIITGDVEISPVVISHKGLTISTIEPAIPPTARNPVAVVRKVVTLDTTQQGGTKLQDLAIAFDQLKVPSEDRISIVKELYRSGKLHAKLIVNGVEQ